MSTDKVPECFVTYEHSKTVRVHISLPLLLSKGFHANLEIRDRTVLCWHSMANLSAKLQLKLACV